MILSSDMMNDLFNVLIGSFGFFGIYDMDIMILLDLQCIAFYLVCVKYQNQDTFLIPLIITQDIHQFISGSLDADFCQFFQLLPCKNNIVSVNQQVFLHSLFFFALFFCILTFVSFWCQSTFSFYFSICADKDFFQFFFCCFRIDSRCSGRSRYLSCCLL